MEPVVVFHALMYGWTCDIFRRLNRLKIERISGNDNRL